MKLSVCRRCKELEIQKFNMEDGIVQVIFLCRQISIDWKTAAEIKTNAYKTIVTIGTLNDQLGLDGTEDFNEDFEVPEKCPYIVEHVVSQ